jgi:hypothetical protein
MEAVYLLKGAAFSLAINVITRGKEPRVPSLRFALSKNISKKGPEPQISPLRCAPVEMTKGRAALPATVVVGQTLFIPLGGSTTHDCSGRDEFCCTRKSFSEKYSTRNKIVIPAGAKRNGGPAVFAP